MMCDCCGWETDADDDMKEYRLGSPSVAGADDYRRWTLCWYCENTRAATKKAFGLSADELPYVDTVRDVVMLLHVLEERIGKQVSAPGAIHEEARHGIRR